MRTIIKKWLFNPFDYLAGYTALWIGLAILFLTAWISYYSEAHFDGVIDLHMAGSGPLSVFIAESFVAWLSLAIVLYISGRILSTSSIRIVDVFGTQALARFPMLLLSFVCFAVPGKDLENYVRWKFLKMGEPVIISTSEIILWVIAGMLVILGVIWAIMLMYRAYTVSCNLKGNRALVSFIISLFIAEILSKFILSFIPIY